MSVKRIWWVLSASSKTFMQDESELKSAFKVFSTIFSNLFNEPQNLAKLFVWFRQTRAFAMIMSLSDGMRKAVFLINSKKPTSLWILFFNAVLKNKRNFWSFWLDNFMERIKWMWAFKLSDSGWKKIGVEFTFNILKSYSRFEIFKCWSEFSLRVTWTAEFLITDIFM